MVHNTTKIPARKENNLYQENDQAQSSKIIVLQKKFQELENKQFMNELKYLLAVRYCDDLSKNILKNKQK